MDTKRLKLLELLSDYLSRPVAELAPLDRFDELDIDSIGLIDMIGVVEKEFSVRIPNEALSNIHSLTELLQALDAQDECANP